MKKFFVLALAAGLAAGCTSDQPVATDNGSNGNRLDRRRTTPPPTTPGTGLLPDLQTVVPWHLQLVNAGQREIIRFSNGIANTGEGHLQVEPVFPLDEEVAQTQDAVQQILDANGNIVQEITVSSFEYHPDHNHWHIDAVALFEIRSGSPTGPIVGDNSVKTTFCLIDWIKLDGNSNSTERQYWDCFGTQGISRGWVDQYHHSTPGQELDITGIPEGRYYLVSTSNPDETFIESNYDNNTAWTSFDLRRSSNGNPKITVVGHSACSGGLCGYSANR